MDVVYGLFHHRLSVARKGGGEEKRVEEPVFEPCQGLKLFSLSSALTWQTLHIFINVDQARYLTVSVYVYLSYVFAKRLPVLNITASNGGCFLLIYFNTSLFWAWLYHFAWVFVSDFQNCTSENGSISTVTVKGQRNAPVVINVKKGETKNQCPQQWEFTG